MPKAVPKRPSGGGLFLGAGIGFAAVLLLCALSAASYVSAVRWVDHTLEVQEEADEWLVAVLDAEACARGFVATGRPVFLEPYQDALTRERTEAALLRSLVMDNATQAQNVGAADRHSQVVMDRVHELIALVRAGHGDEALAHLVSDESKRDLELFRDDSRRIRREEGLLLTDRRSRSSARGWTTLGGTVFLAMCSLVLLAIAWKREHLHDETVTNIAIEARGRLKALTDLAAALADARSPSHVAEMIVDQGIRAVGADTCTLYSLDESGTVLDLIGHRGVAPDMIDKIRRITSTSGDPASFAAMRAGSPIWVENEAEYTTLYPELAAMKDRRAHAFWSAPLIVEERPVGLLGMGFYEPHTFSADERVFVTTLSQQCAQALLRASRLERENELRRWLATTLRSIGDAVIATDAGGRITFMNPIAERITGWIEGDARGRLLDEVFCIFSEQTRKAVESPVSKVLREGTVVGLANHTVLRSKRGGETPIDDSGAPIRTEDGKVVGVVLVFRDVTREKREHARNEFLSKAGEVLVSSIDYETTLATVARLAVPTIADWCAVDLVEAGSPALKQVAVAHADPSKVQLARELGERYPVAPDAPTGMPNVVRTGQAELYEEIPRELIERSAKDPEHLRLLSELHLESGMVVPLRSHGRTFGAMTLVYAESGRRYTKDDFAFVEDFARRAAMAIENAVALKEAKDRRAREQSLRREAEIANRAKDDFLATVSHELRTPLNSILGWTVILRGRKPSLEFDRPLGVIERNARAQARLLEDVLDVSSIISGKLCLNMGPTHLAGIVGAAIETISPAAENKEITIQSDIEDESLTITADANRLQQIVWNLLSNAVKFTPKHGRVSVRVCRVGSNAFIRVSDTGEGILPEVIPVIFEPFLQGDSSSTRRHGGLGLGLAIVKQLVAAHGGSVHAQSEGLDKGATFIVELPARNAIPAIGRPAGSFGIATPLPVVVGGPRLDGLRLLVVDDEQDALALLMEALGSQGAEVHVAISGSEALDKLQALKPDVIVSDVGMPGMDGYALIRTIRSLPPEAGGRTPAVALTAYARPADAQRAFVAGYQMHVTKPVEPMQLATVVANLGGRSLEEASRPL